MQQNTEKINGNNDMSENQHLSTSAIPSDLLSTKLALPRPRHSLVPRESLFSLLDSSMDHAITLLSAPAGFGKTTLARTWITSRNANQEQFKVAWLSLDAGDNDPIRFWRYVIAACQRFDTTIGQTALKWISAARPFHYYEIEMIKYGFDAVLSSKKALEQTASLEKPLPLAMTKTAFRFLNAVPSLKRRVFSGFGEN